MDGERGVGEGEESQGRGPHSQPFCSLTLPALSTAGVGPVLPGQAGSLAWGDKVAYAVRFV